MLIIWVVLGSLLLVVLTEPTKKEKLKIIKIKAEKFPSYPSKDFITAINLQKVSGDISKILLKEINRITDIVRLLRALLKCMQNRATG